MSDPGFIARTFANTVYLTIVSGSLIGAVILGFTGIRVLFPPIYELGPLASGAVLLTGFIPLALTAGFWMSMAGRGGPDE